MPVKFVRAKSRLFAEPPTGDIVGFGDIPDVHSLTMLLTLASCDERQPVLTRRQARESAIENLLSNT